MSTGKGTTNQTYSRRAIGLHWLSAVLVLSLWPMGKLMDGESTGFGGAGLYSIHIWIGLTVCVLTIIRVVQHFFGQQPEKLDMPGWEKLLFTLNHYGLYLVLLGAALTGIGMLLNASFLPMPFSRFKPQIFEDSGGPTDLHESVTNIFMLLFVMHVAGVIYYQVKHGRTLRRIGVPIGS